MKVTYSSTAHTINTRHFYLPEIRESENLQQYMGRLFRFLRQCYGLSQAELAKQSGKKQSYISRLKKLYTQMSQRI